MTIRFNQQSVQNVLVLHNRYFEDLSLLKVQIAQDIAETYKILKVQNG